MISRPTTEQLLNSCARELIEVVLPAVEDETVKVTVMMLDLVVRNAALRAAHEIAWMTEEIEALTRTSRAPPRTAAASSLHLDDVVQAYCEASEAFSRAMDSAADAGDDAMVRLGHRPHRRGCHPRASGHGGLDARRTLTLLQRFEGWRRTRRRSATRHQGPGGTRPRSGSR